jgi:hypothetical protein
MECTENAQCDPAMFCHYMNKDDAAIDLRRCLKKWDGLIPISAEDLPTDEFGWMFSPENVRGEHQLQDYLHNG